MNAISCSFTHKRLRFTSVAKTLSDRDAILFEDNSLKKRIIFGNQKDNRSNTRTYMKKSFVCFLWAPKKIPFNAIKEIS